MRNDRFLALTGEQAVALEGALGVGPERIHVVGAGYAESLFHARGRVEPDRPVLLYAGKLARAKGLPWLLEAVAELARARPGLVLEVAGGGSGAEADELRAAMAGMAPVVRTHGRLDQPALADLARAASVLVLPSLHEGLPLVVVEALACGCRAVVTRLPGIETELAPHLGASLLLVDPPRLVGPDEPLAEDLPRFVSDLARALDRALDRPPAAPPPGLRRFTWASVFDRVERLWRELAPGLRAG